MVVTAWLSDAGRQRLLEAIDCEATDDLDRAGDADLVAVSTRLPKGLSTSIVGELRAATSAPIVAVAHAGGEGAAVRMLATGGTGVVAEGNEEALRSFLDPDHHDERLVDTYVQSMERRSGGQGPGRGLDPVTGLPGAAALEERLRELSQGEELPRLAFVRMPGYAEVARRLSFDAAELLRRRVAAGSPGCRRPRPAPASAAGQPPCGLSAFVGHPRWRFGDFVAFRGRYLGTVSTPPAKSSRGTREVERVAQGKGAV